MSVSVYFRSIAQRWLKASRYAAKKQNNNSGSSPSTFLYFDIMNDINLYPAHRGVE